ncbi:MAG: GNAT family N-acetyltransferase [Bosea sp. (in: a-proteobacteria)]
MLSAAQHLPATHTPVALVLRNSQRLLGIIALESARLPVLPGALHSFVTPYHPVGVPLIDRRHAAAVIERTLQWCAEQAEPLNSISGETLGLAGIVWRKLPLDGPFAAVLRQIAAQSGRGLRTLDEYQRPVLLGNQSVESPQDSAATKPSRNLRKLVKRLHELGTLRLAEANTKPEINQALEALMVLEAASWKGERGSAMVQDTRISCFIRSTVRQMAARGQASIITMASGETPIAAALILEAQGVYFCFKIAYDPAFAKYSPGMILAHEIGMRLSARPGFRYADSCVDNADSFMSRVWQDRACFGDMMIDLQGHATPAASAMQMREQLRRRVRASAKAIYHQLYHRLHG